MTEEIKKTEEVEDITQAPKYWLPGNVYTVLKWIGLALIPVISWAYSSLGEVWGWPSVEQVTTTLDVIGVAVAVVIGASSLKAKLSK